MAVGTRTARTSPHSSIGRQFSFKDVPRIRAEATTKDGDDGQRIAYGTFLWDSQEDVMRVRDRQIEEGLRMLAGQQWTVFHPRIGRFIDVTRWMTDEERRWRQRPVFNRLLPWFMLTHARMQENPPIVTFVPGPDAIDSQLAATMDIIFKAKWRTVGMAEIWDRESAWIIASGTAYLQSRLDLNKGDLMPNVGMAPLPKIGPDGQQLEDENGPMETEEEFETGFDEDGNPTRAMTADGPVDTDRETFVDRRGELAVDVLNALQVRGEWAPVPWHEKKWHMTRTFQAPEVLFEMFGRDVTNEAISTMDDGGRLQRILFGKGFFGAANAFFGADFATPTMPEVLNEVFTLWHRPAKFAGMEEKQNSAGGRLMIFTRESVLYDSHRPVRYTYTSPIREFKFVGVPGRHSGTTPLEALIGAQRAYNRGWAQILEHRNLVTNPKMIIDSASGLEDTQITNKPGQAHVVTRTPNVPPFEWISPPPLGQDVYNTQALLLNELTDLGSLAGTEGDAPTEDASGELVKELRFNSDRFLGPTMRRSVEEFGRMVEDWMKLLPIIMDEEQVFAYAGEDNVARTVTVMPEMFQEGKVNIIADVESMLPEGRGERQQKITALYANGLFGPPGTPESIKAFFDLSSFPHLDRARKFGGPDRTTADQENGRLLRGDNPTEIPMHDFYDDMIHLMVHEDFMKSPEFLKQPPQVQQAFQFHRGMHILNVQIKIAGTIPQGAEEQNISNRGGAGGDPGATSGAAGPEGTTERQPQSNAGEAATASGQGVAR